MVREIVDTKIRTLIKAYLVLNKGRKCSGKEIAEFINSNGFGLNQYTLHPRRVSSMVNSARSRRTNILCNVNVEKVGGVNHFYL